jgi:hypothetical protein
MGQVGFVFKRAELKTVDPIPLLSGLPPRRERQHKNRAALYKFIFPHSFHAMPAQYEIQENQMGHLCR